MVCFYCRWNNNKLYFETAKGCFVSTTHTEYVPSIEDSKEIIWLQRFMEELGKKKENKRCTLTEKVSFILQRTHPFIRRLNIYNSSTIS